MFELQDLLRTLKAVIHYLFVSWSTCQTNERGDGGGRKGVLYVLLVLDSRVSLNSNFEKVLMGLYSWYSL